SAGERWKAYKAAGAVGAISIANPKSMDVPWARATLARLHPQMSLADASLDDAGGQQLAVTMNPAHAEKLFAGSGHTFAEMLALVDGGRPVPHFALPARIKATARVENGEVESQNVAAVLRGADPQRRNEFVRSDQYSFIRGGVPALAMKVGYEPGTPEAEIARKWTAERYHSVTDDLAQPIDLSAAEKYVDVVRTLAIRIANRTDRP